MEDLYCNSRKVEKISFKKMHSFYVRDTNSSALDSVFASLYLFILSTSHILCVTDNLDKRTKEFIDVLVNKCNFSCEALVAYIKLYD